MQQGQKENCYPLLTTNCMKYCGSFLSSECSILYVRTASGNNGQQDEFSKFIVVRMLLAEWILVYAPFRVQNNGQSKVKDQHNRSNLFDIGPSDRSHFGSGNEIDFRSPWNVAPWNG
jgi:hypothetical protein